MYADVSATVLNQPQNTVATPVLTKLFNRSLDSSVFPAIWKQGKVTTLFKSGGKSDCNNYRPSQYFRQLVRFLREQYINNYMAI